MARKANILLVEDDQGVRQALNNALIAENYGVVATASGREAIREFGAQQIDVALLDVNLGDESGWEILAKLLEVRPRLSVIVMSGRSQHAAPSKDRAAVVMEKPLDLPALFATLDRLTAHCHETATLPGSGAIEARVE